MTINAMNLRYRMHSLRHRARLDQLTHMLAEIDTIMREMDTLLREVERQLSGSPAEGDLDIDALRADYKEDA